MDRHPRPDHLQRRHQQPHPSLLHRGHLAMKYGTGRSRMGGFGLLELMLAAALGLIVVAGVIVIFVAQRQVYNNSSSQSLIQDSDNAIAALVTPVVRGAGFTGCGTIGNGVISSISSPATPLTFNANSTVQGYTGTMPASLVDNAGDDSTASDWTPSLDASITTASNGGPEQGSDVLVVIGAAQNASPIGVTAPITGSPIAVNDTTQLEAINGGGAQMVAVSDCSKSTIFMATGIGSDSVAFSSGPGSTPSYQANSQLIPVQQTVFFVAKGDGGQSALWQGVMTLPAGATTAAGAAWKMNEMVPGVAAMKVLYGIGAGGDETAGQYVDASEVSDWSQVTSVKLGFVVEGGLGSATVPPAAWSYTLFGKTVSMPADSRMRHVFYLTVNTRNTTL
ncbi:PilW family protein [Rhodanobacter sp. Si-c]|uniref:PilW family protein n=1 Tax=Rhodanobacter lycopersici TaxID=3162487 RepID=A0ABV3QH09_9GAMM